MAFGIPVSGIRDYFQRHLELRLQYSLIAYNDTVEIYATIEDGKPAFIVDIEGETVLNKTAPSLSEVERIYAELKEAYLEVDSDEEDEDVPTDAIDDEDFSDDDLQRLQDIEDAVADMLYVLIGDQADGMSMDEFGELVFRIESYLHELKIPVRHPVMDDGRIVQFPFGGDEEEEEDAGAEVS